MTEQRDPVIVAFERQVRHDAVVMHMQALHRLRSLRGSTRTWWAVRQYLRKREGNQ